MSTADTAMLIAIVNEDGSAAVVAGDVLTEFDTATVEDGRHAIMMHAIAAAQERDAAVRLHVTEPDGTWPLIVHADGDVQPDEDGEAAEASDSPERGDADDSAPREEAAESDDAPQDDSTPDDSTQNEVATQDEDGDPEDAEPTQPEPEPEPVAQAAPSTESGPIELPDPLRGSGLVTTSLPVLGVSFDDDDDDSDVVDDPSPEPPTRRQQREATDPSPVSEPLPSVAPQPLSAAATPKATTSVEP
ncbi:hypothetical protein E4U02_15310, partial [Microbacterium paludicola]